ncbi:MAG: hypothetical protein Q8K12_14980 [Thiobacillus sp.]|nr:hypothetical protein [Thiobacillus sp.]
MAGIIGNNSIGYRHRLGKVDRAIRRTSNRLLDKVLTKKSQIFVVEVAENKFLEVIWGTPDAERLNRCFEYIARGLYFHHFKIPFLGTVRVHLGYLLHQDNSARNFSAFIKRKSELELEEKDRYGENSQIFFYQVTDSDQFGLFLFRLCFYGGLNVYISFIPQDVTLPKSLAFELMNHGIKTVFTLGDETFEIN